MTRSRSKADLMTRGGAAAPSSDTKRGKKSKAAWKLLDRGSVAAAGVLAPVVSAGAWRLVTGRRPPTLSRSPEVDAREAVAWAVVGGALVEVVKVVVRRQAADYWVRSTGELPPGLTPKKPRHGEEPVSVAEPAPRTRFARR